MDAGSTYVIDRKELMKEYRVNRKLRQLIHEGNYVYADGHVCCNLSQWIEQNGDRPRLTLQAEKHIDQCCLRFRSIYELNEISEYEYGRLACDEEYNKHYLNYVDCQKITPIEAHKSISAFRRELPDGFFPALDFLRNEKRISLEKLEELSHVSRKKIDRERKKTKWSLTRDEVIALCVALKMPPWLSDEMLKRAHIALDENDSIDQTYRIILDLLYMDDIDHVQEQLRKSGCEELVLSY